MGSTGAPPTVKLSPEMVGFWFGRYAARKAVAVASEASGRSQVMRSRPTAKEVPRATVIGW